MAESTLLEVKNLTKRFGKYTAVDGVSFGVSRGEVLGFLGPNGAGKTTTMRMVTGFLEPDNGEVVVCGHLVSEAPIEAKNKIGYLPEGVPLYSEMTPRMFLNFIATARGLRNDEIKKRFSYVVEKLELESVLDQSIETLSKGYKRRVAFAQAILHDPSIVILDEPTDGLDPVQKKQVRELIKEMSREKAVIISTHILEEVTAVCDRIVIISSGRLVADETPQSFIEKDKWHNAVSFIISGVDIGTSVEKLRSLPYVFDVQVQNLDESRKCIVVFPVVSKDISTEIIKYVYDMGWQLDSISIHSGDMEEVFRSIVTSKN